MWRIILFDQSEYIPSVGAGVGSSVGAGVGSSVGAGVGSIKPKWNIYHINVMHH